MLTQSIWLLIVFVIVTILITNAQEQDQDQGTEPEPQSEEEGTTVDPDAKGPVGQVLDTVHDTWYEALYHGISYFNWYILRNIGSDVGPYGLGWPVVWDIFSGRDDSVSEQTANTADSTIQTVLFNPFWALSYLIDSNFLQWAWWGISNFGYYAFRALYYVIDSGSGDEE